MNVVLLNAMNETFQLVHQKTLYFLQKGTTMKLLIVFGQEGIRQLSYHKN